MLLQLILASTVISGGLALNVINLDGSDWTASAFLATPRATNCSFASNTDFKPHGGGSSGYNSGKVADAQACCARLTFVLRRLNVNLGTALFLCACKDK